MYKYAEIWKNFMVEFGNFQCCFNVLIMVTFEKNFMQRFGKILYSAIWKILMLLCWCYLKKKFHAMIWKHFDVTMY